LILWEFWFCGVSFDFVGVLILWELGFVGALMLCEFDVG
jgi:hypothetical protein